MEDLSKLQNELFSTHGNEEKRAGNEDSDFSAMESVAEAPIMTFVATKVSAETSDQQTSSSSESQKVEPDDISDQLYQPMLDDALDDEATLEDEEKDGDADDGELDELERMGELPLEELLRMYGAGGSTSEKAPAEPVLQLKSELESVNINAGPSGLQNETDLDNVVVESSMLSANINDDEDWTTSSDDEEYTVEDEDKLARERSELMKFLTRIGVDNPNEGSHDESSSDDEFIPVHLMMLKREVPLGPSRQVEPPELDAQYDDIISSPTDEVLQWAPRLPENEVIEYLKAAYIQERELLKKEIPADQVTQTDVADDEEFLKELLDCNYEKDEALRRCRRNFRPGRYESSKWSDKECEDFEAAIMENWKRFNIVQTAVPTRTVKEVVEFYYRWKKSDRFEPFLARVRLSDGKTQHNLEEKSKFRVNGKKRPLDAMDAVAEDKLAETEKEKSTVEPRPKSVRLDPLNSACSLLLEDTVEVVCRDLLTQGGPSGS